MTFSSPWQGIGTFWFNLATNLYILARRDWSLKTICAQELLKITRRACVYLVLGLCRLYYGVVARVLVNGIIPVGLLIILNTKIFLALKKIRSSVRIKSSSAGSNTRKRKSSMLYFQDYRRVVPKNRPGCFDVGLYMPPGPK